MSNLIPFEYEGKPVRIVEQDGEPWFVAADVCAVLGLTNSRMATQALDDDEKGVSQTDTPGGVQEVVIISEPGMYKLVVRSDKPTAKPFIRFVTHDVLPAIRKTGRYEAPNAPAADPLPDPGMLARLVNSASRIGGVAAGKAVLNKYGIVFDTTAEPVMHRAVHDRLHGSVPELTHKERVFNIIFDAGKKGIVKRILTRKTQFLDGSYERDQIIDQLEKDGSIYHRVTVSGRNHVKTYAVKPSLSH